jgi:hypothetical protein
MSRFTTQALLVEGKQGTGNELSLRWIAKEPIEFAEVFPICLYWAGSTEMIPGNLPCPSMSLPEVKR